MSIYTTELRYPLEQGFDIGLKSYEIFEENYRDYLNTKIINHFYFREIGYPTWERFKFALNQKMIEIMPYYNHLYNLEFNELLVNRDITVTEDNLFNVKEDTGYESNSSDDRNATSSDEGSSKDISKGITSDTPMGKLGDIFSQEYATATTQNDNDISSTNKNTSQSKNLHTLKSDNNRTYDRDEDKKLHRKGYEGARTKGELILKYKDIFFNIDMLVIRELEGLFMGVW